MLSMFGIIKHELKKQGKLPAKYDEVPKELVLDACTFYIDGINNIDSGHSSASSTKWKNLKGSQTASLFSSPKWYDDHAYLTGGKNYCYFESKVVPDVSTNFTIEAVFSMGEDPDGTFNAIICDNHWSWGFILYTSTNGSVAFRTCTQVIQGNSKYQAIYSGDLLLKANRIVYACARMNSTEGKSLFTSLTNSATIDSTIKTSAGGLRANSPLYVGSPRQNFDSSSGKSINLYALRMHKRCLTDEEMKQNMAYDKNRYNFE